MSNMFIETQYRQQGSSVGTTSIKLVTNKRSGKVTAVIQHTIEERKELSGSVLDDFEKLMDDIQQERGFVPRLKNIREFVIKGRTG